MVYRYRLSMLYCCIVLELHFSSYANGFQRCVNNLKKMSLLPTTPTLLSAITTRQSPLHLSNNSDDDNNSDDGNNNDNDDYDDDYYRSILSPEAYYVMREEGTEAPWSSPLNYVNDPGLFACAACRRPLFLSSKRYDSGTGWPSFTSPVDRDAVTFSTDYSMIIPRTECRCASCDLHLGHVFDDGPKPPHNSRYCMNGVAMDFIPREDLIMSTSGSSTSSSQAKDDTTTTSTTTVLMMDADTRDALLQKMSNDNDVVVSLPTSSILPSILLNAGVTGLFFSSFARYKHQWGLQYDWILQFLDLIPIVGALYYGLMTAKGLARLLQSTSSFDNN